jgi:hypothetical protein
MVLRNRGNCLLPLPYICVSCVLVKISWTVGNSLSCRQYFSFEFGRSRVQNSAQRPSILTEVIVLFCFFQYVQVDAGVMLKIGVRYKSYPSCCDRKASQIVLQVLLQTICNSRKNCRSYTMHP